MDSRFPVFYTDVFLGHDTGDSHPENSGRLTAVVDYLNCCQMSTEKGLEWAQKIEWLSPSARATLPIVERVHDAGYLQRLKTISAEGGGYLDGDTALSTQSYDVALLAVAAWLDGADWVWRQRSPGFALVRPPGHHAERGQGMGFCLLSNAAIAAHYALDTLGAKRVAILDWDVHHGNGTQALVATNSQIAYCSFHQSPAYPGTGAATETGQHGNVLNIPMPPGSTLLDYQRLWSAKAEPFLVSFDADVLLVSAGYDANQADPLAGICLQPADYYWFTQACLSLTPAVLFGLEGGYDYQALAQSVAATIRAACECQYDQGCTVKSS
ncbi:MAG: histone deacetylase [Cyanobacteria bacterium J06626_6]